jgi:hypothetical protein
MAAAAIVPANAIFILFNMFWSLFTYSNIGMPHCIQ